MGVPGFFAWLMKKYKNDKFIFSNIENNISSLYIDANCLFHPQCFKILNKMVDEKNIDKLEKMMIDRIIDYINYLIEYVNPRNLVYIAVDGVAPVAKINQQRKRRFRSAQDKIIYDDIKNKYGKKYNNIWNNTVITPGTLFMEKLHDGIMEYCSKKKKNKYKIIYSSYHTPGEGEHKILQHIKNDDSNIKVIYGLDADLFFLAMASHINNIYLLREESHIQNNRDDNADDSIEENLCYVSIDETKNGFNNMVRKIFIDKIEASSYNINILDIENTDFCDDFIFICYLLGNDFLPHFPSIDIKKGGLDIVIESYCDIYLSSGSNIVYFHNGEICVDYHIFCGLIKNLGDKENDFFKIILPDYNMKQKRKKCFSRDNYDREVWRLDNLIDIDIYDDIKLGQDNQNEWKFRYYEHYFHSTYYQQEIIDNVCKNYLEGLKWVTQYYFKKCDDWKWQYKYNHAPFISDIYHYIKSKNIDINNIVFSSKEPLNCFTQLLCVLPPAYSQSLPSDYRYLTTSYKSPIIDMFPSNVSLDCINKDQYWQCIPNVPYLDVNRIETAISNIKINKKDNSRNTIQSEYIFKK